MSTLADKLNAPEEKIVKKSRAKKEEISEETK